MFKTLSRGLFPLSALLVMMIVLQGCPPGNGNGNGDDNGNGNGYGNGDEALCPEKDPDALIVTISPGGSVDPAHAEISLGTDPETGRPLKLQWYNTSGETYLIGLNNEALNFALPTGQYSYVLTAQYNADQPVDEQIGAFTYNISTVGGFVPPGTPDVDVGP